MTQEEKKLIKELNELEESIMQDETITGGDIDEWIENWDGSEILINIEHARQKVAQGDTKSVRYLLNHMRPGERYETSEIADEI